MESPPGITEQSWRKLTAPERNLERMEADEITLPLAPEAQLEDVNAQIRRLQARLLKDYGAKGLTRAMLETTPPDIDAFLRIGLKESTDIIPLLKLRIEAATTSGAVYARQRPSRRDTGALAPREPTQSAIFPRLTGVGRKTRKHGPARLRRHRRGRVSRRNPTIGSRYATVRRS